ncbi:MAG: hypothetical protein KA810_06680, partial [Pyrinomonadaceae bacterium]|nr:hypothetical protein [Pyrinomonadaceae bacterium]
MRETVKSIMSVNRIFLTLAVGALLFAMVSAGASAAGFPVLSSVSDFFSMQAPIQKNGTPVNEGIAQVAPIDGSDDLWQDVAESVVLSSGERQIVPESYRVLKLNEDLMKSTLAQAPPETEKDSRARQLVITLPLPDGRLSRFRVFESSIMEKGLADKFPELRTYAGQGIDEPAAVVRFDYTPAGFHAMILRPDGSVFIDPYAKGNTANYISYLKRDFDNPGKQFECLVGKDASRMFEPKNLPATLDMPNIVSNGGTLHTYRLAMAATGEYTAFHGGTVAGALAAITTTMNRVNGVYERDLSVRMILIANNNLIIYTNAATDPYANTSGDRPANQANVDLVIGSANYDIGHLVGTGAGGVATLNSPCNSSTKAQGLTGSPSPVGDPFDIDYVAHEMGHQYGGNHTFNSEEGSCSGGNREASAAFEPGSGATIQAYAGICGNSDLQKNTDDYFHIRSLEEMTSFINTNSCDVESANGNNQPVVTVPASFNIPANTAFALTGSATDANGDAVTYTWEEYDLGASTNAIPNTDASGGARPIFRSYKPSTSPTRYFPSLPFILNNANVPPSTFAGTNAVGTVCSSGNCVTGELLPTITRTMNFQLTSRDNRAGGGGVNSAQTAVTVDGGSGPFNVTSPNTAVSYTANTLQTVTWSVANTTAAPVNAANVKISISTDGGLTFPTVLIASTPNDGSASVAIPNTPTAMARIKVEAVGNIFFDISNVNFTITPPATAPVYTPPANQSSNEGTSTAFALGSFVDPDGGPWTATINWGDASANTVLNPAVAGTLGSSNHTYAQDGTYTVSITVADSGALSDTESFTITVANVAPSALVLNLSSGTINENGSTNLSGSFTDPGTLDTHQVTIAWGDGSTNTVLNLAAGDTTIPSTAHTYLDDNPSGTSSDNYTITVTVVDSFPASTSGMRTVTVNNGAPSAVTLNLSASTLNENGSTSLSGGFTDPGTLDTHTVTINWGDGSALQTLPTLGAGVTTIPATSHTYLDDNPSGTASDIYTITVTVIDDDTGTGSNTTSVTVNNVAPSGISLSRTPTTINEGQSTALSGSFTDPGTLDPHTVTINWGDGSANTVLNLLAGVTTIPSTSHTYLDDNPVGTSSDVYTITVTVADDDLGSARPGVGSTGNIIADLSDADAAILAERLKTHSRLKAPAIPEIVKTELPELSELRPLAPCTNGSPFGTGAINASGSVVQITTCVFAGEYNTISGAVAGQTLTFTDDVAGDEITIRSGTPGGPVLAVGSSPLTFLNTFTGTIYAHVNTAGCGSQFACRTTTIQCTSCLPVVPATTTVTVTNVNPTATFTNGGPYVCGQDGTVTFSGQADPSAADLAGLHYSYDFDNNGTWEVGNGTYGGSGTGASATVPANPYLLPPGTHVVKGRLMDDDLGLNDYTTAITVNKANSTTTVTASPVGPSIFGQAVTFTATVAPVAPGAGVPSGTVTFNIDGNLYCINTPL